MSGLLLHPEFLLKVPFRGKRLARDLEKRAQEVAARIAAKPADRSVGVTVLIRTKNNEVEIGQLLDDIRANQEYFAGPVQVVLVDTESTDDTLFIAKHYDKFFEVTIVPIKQKDFDYATSLNVGFEAARHALVFVLVGHSCLSNKLTLAAAVMYANMPDFIGGFCYTVPNANASLTEKLAMGFYEPAGMISRPAVPLTKEVMGMMGGNCSLVRREAWEKLGGYDPRYGAGGEDADFGRRALAAGYKIMIDPVLTVHHTHGLSFLDNLRQLHYWSKLGKPVPFDAAKLAKFRNDLALEDKADSPAD